MNYFEIISLDLFSTLVYIDRPSYDPWSKMKDALRQSPEFRNEVMPKTSIEEVCESYYTIIRKEMKEISKETEFKNDEVLLSIWENEVEITPLLRKAAVQIVNYYFDNLLYLIHPYPGVHETLDYLKEKEYRLVLSSNHSWPQNGYAVLKNLKLLRYFEKTMFSGEMGWKKPSKRFFSEVFLDFDTQKDRILHIGDDLDRDIVGALNYGVKALWIRLPRYESIDVSDLAIEGIINNITEIHKFL
jgi:HAD superfamily hydrolase (TIGR01549 family)